jgi:hypothetical protein
MGIELLAETGQASCPAVSTSRAAMPESFRKSRLVVTRSFNRAYFLILLALLSSSCAKPKRTLWKRVSEAIAHALQTLSPNDAKGFFKHA